MNQEKKDKTKIYNHLLLATDFSPISMEAAKEADQLALGLDAKLSVVHCIEEMPGLMGEMQSPLLEKAKVQLGDLKDSLQTPNASLKIAFGTPKKAILEAAAELKVDLIIIGSHGHHGIGHLLGSTANAISHTASCDVWVIRPK